MKTLLSTMIIFLGCLVVFPVALLAWLFIGDPRDIIDYIDIYEEEKASFEEIIYVVESYTEENGGHGFSFSEAINSYDVTVVGQLSKIENPRISDKNIRSERPPQICFSYYRGGLFDFTYYMICHFEGEKEDLWGFRGDDGYYQHSGFYDDCDFLRSLDRNDRRRMGAGGVYCQIEENWYGYAYLD